jgi:hypothetical protein
MITHNKLQELLETAAFRLLNKTPNSDSFISSRLQKAKLEREKIISIIASDATLSAEIAIMKNEVELIDHALVAYV